MPSAFNENVYALVSRIPSGKVLSYGRVAQLIGVPRGARAVGWALHALANERGVPWQRVINAKGYISTSCLDHTAEMQRALLETEGITFDEHGLVDMKRFMWPITIWEVQVED